jgi:A/G-specific adenine glycosylase
MSRELLASPAAPAPALRAALRRRLLAWYRRHRRPMPWRGTRDPYRIWVSEVMLQQTQVAAAHPFYQRFIARFPSLEALSRARSADVLAAWAGLGYYRRARHLLEAARIVVREHAGRVPDDPEAFGRLPGVGRYTTGAVLSIAFDHPLPALDGNVGRVLARLFALPAAIRDPRGARALWALAGALVPARGAGDWNQAIMELGATVCLPRAPRCPACPVRARCRAHASGRVAAFPPVVARRRTERVRRAVALIERSGRLLLVRRDGALLGGLWEPPGVDLADGVPARRALAVALARLGLRARLAPTGRTVHHTITHRAIEVEVWRARLTAAPPRRAGLGLAGPGGRRLPLTALARKLAALRGMS